VADRVLGRDPGLAVGTFIIHSVAAR
jgi:hypothetical protein